MTDTHTVQIYQPLNFLAKTLITPLTGTSKSFLTKLLQVVLCSVIPGATNFHTYWFTLNVFEVFINNQTARGQSYILYRLHFMFHFWPPANFILGDSCPNIIQQFGASVYYIYHAAKSGNMGCPNNSYIHQVLHRMCKCSLGHGCECTVAGMPVILCYKAS